MPLLRDLHRAQETGGAELRFAILIEKLPPRQRSDTREGDSEDARPRPPSLFEPNGISVTLHDRQVRLVRL
jgi:hypothetical protein